MNVMARLQTTPSAERQGDDAERCGLSNCQLRWVKSEDSLLINSEKKSGKLVVLLDEFEVVNEAEFSTLFTLQEIRRQRLRHLWISSERSYRKRKEKKK